jgi:hypothetical protein
MHKEQIETAIDIAMIVAIGKLILFEKCWGLLETHLKKRKIISNQDKEMIRRGLREVVNGIADEFFFIPPDKAISRVHIAEYFEKRFGEDKVLDKILKAYRISLIQTYPSLSDFSY